MNKNSWKHINWRVRIEKMAVKRCWNACETKEVSQKSAATQLAVGNRWNESKWLWLVQDTRTTGQRKTGLRLRPLYEEWKRIVKFYSYQWKNFWKKPMVLEGSLFKNIQLLLVFFEVSILALHFSFYTSMTFQLLSVILLYMLILDSILGVIRQQVELVTEL